MEEKKFHNSKLLRYGYTTGSCAAAAAKAAAQMLRTGQPVSQVRIVTPSGVPLTLDVLDPVLGEDSASCAIRKDGGDDPDAIWRFVDCGRIANAFPYLLLDILGDADDIADGTILIFHTRVQDATAVRHTIKSDINLNSSFAKFLANICL